MLPERLAYVVLFFFFWSEEDEVAGVARAVCDDMLYTVVVDG